MFQRYRPSVRAQQTRGALLLSEYLLLSKDLLLGREHLQARLGPSKWEWRALVAVEIETEGRILDLVGADRGWLEREATETLAELGIAKVTAHTLTDIDRNVTQRLVNVPREVVSG